MKVARKLLATGGATLVIAGGVLAFPAALPVGATHGHGGSNNSNSSYVLKEESNATFGVKTEVSPYKHALWSTVTNKSNAPITPTVTFNGEVAKSYSTKPLDPGKSRTYVHFFIGNNFAVDVKVAADGVDPFTSSGVVNLPESVTFQTTSTDADNRTVTGTLTNNTSDPQTVYLKTHKKNKSVENLAPNETRTITVTSDTYKDKSNERSKHSSDRDYKNNFVRLSVKTSAGYEGKYIIPTTIKTNEPIPLDS